MSPNQQPATPSLLGLHFLRSLHAGKQRLLKPQLWPAPNTASPGVLEVSGPCRQPFQIRYTSHTCLSRTHRSALNRNIGCRLSAHQSQLALRNSCAAQHPNRMGNKLPRCVKSCRDPDNLDISSMSTHLKIEPATQSVDCRASRGRNQHIMAYSDGYS